MRSFLTHYLAAIAAIALSVNSTSGQVTFGQKPRAAVPATAATPLESAAEPRMAMPPTRATNVNPNSPLTAGAEVSFLIVEENELTRVIIADSGELEIPGGLGRIPVAGLTSSEAQARVKAHLEDKYYKPGKGTVRIGLNTLPASGQKKSKVTVSGTVGRPGTVDFYANDPKKLSEVVLEVGTTAWSKLNKVLVVRGAQQMEYDVEKILEGTLKDIPMQDGDLVKVPKVGWRMN